MQEKADIPTKRGSRAVKGHLGHMSLETFEGRLGGGGGRGWQNPARTGVHERCTGESRPGC